MSDEASKSKHLEPEGARHWVKYLEMTEPPARRAEAPPAGAEIVRVEDLDLDAYRALYRRVGDPGDGVRGGVWMTRACVSFSRSRVTSCST